MNYTPSTLARGYANRILAVDLSSDSIATPDLDPQVRDFFIGGRSLGLTRCTSPSTATPKPLIRPTR